ncbi:hypothetical protein EB22_01365 [Enterococcus faecium]|uniref:glycosyltransferase family 1 protein n=1 Tax=Enterococcus TaxID=1350 RepID=UPI000DE8B0C4|nr:glycosyltransferase family 1 protein [Enterococcus faecium]RBS48117.1 hypothetical protein EB22_01365 [Enterococcus faecium]
MKILVLSNEVWNDKINGNNVTTNWFERMKAEFANIYASPEAPYNTCCEKYFQITDTMMLNSIIKGVKAGKTLGRIETGTGVQESIAESEPKKLYRFLKSISGSFLRLVRELLWLWGKYDVAAMKQFVDEFQPDVIFSERMASCKMLRLERIVCSLTDAPLFAFTGDDEYSLKQFSLSPFFWINRFMVRKRLRENVKNYKIYYTLSLEQKEYYERIFGCQCKILQKCGEFDAEYENHIVHQPIKLIYAGKFYCNRWKVLGKIADAIRELNKDDLKMVLEIYTKDVPTKKQNRLLNDGQSAIIKGAVSQEELREIYHQADVALHVESDDLKYRLATRFSFSTKIIDCIFSGCAVMAYCWDQHSGLTYLKREDAGICVSSEQELKSVLHQICCDPSMICDYSHKAYLCGQKNHNRQQVQEMLLEDFRKYFVTSGGYCKE